MSRRGRILLGLLDLSRWDRLVVPNCQKLPTFARNIPEMRRSHLHCAGSLKSHIIQESKGWPNSRSRPLFGLYQNLLAASVRWIAIRLTAFLGQNTSAKKPSPKSRYRSRLPDDQLKHCLHLCLSNYEPSYSKFSQCC